MRERFGLLQRIVARWLTAHVHIEQRQVDALRRLGDQGTIVYIVRQRSLLDYMLINWLLLREGLPLARFANGVSSGWFASSPQMVREVASWVRRLGGHRGRSARQVAGDVVESGAPVLFFLRARGPRLFAPARSWLAAARPGNELLQEVITRAQATGRSIHLVPISLFRGRVIRRQGNQLSALAYSVHDAPSDLKKLLTYALNREDLLLKIGRVIDLDDFLSANRALSQSRLARRLTHSLQRELAQEERAVWGPLILPREVIAERVFEGREVSAAVSRIAAERGVSERRTWREARRYFWEMAADFNGLAFGIIEIVFRQIWQRAFSGVEVRGLDRVVECVKRHPVVLVPCHRSHFDYMVLSYIFRESFLSPPHIAAGINLAFWPMSWFLRGAGAFFIHRTFEDNELYKLVFHRYLSALIRQGYTIEFFIEGGRSRTGKILTPKLGMLSGVVRAFLQGARQDLYLVPVSIHYGRIAEETAYDAELSGAGKEKETFGALLRARSVLKQRHGTVYVSFSEPLSLRDTLGERRQQFAAYVDGDARSQDEVRRFVQKLGFRILREVNEAAVVGATSLSATVLLSASGGIVSFQEYVGSCRMLAEVLRWRGAAFTPSLERNLAQSNFAEITGFLASSKLVDLVEENGQRQLRVPVGKRKVLDFYKNNTIHFFLLSALVANALARGIPRRDLKEEIWWWLGLFRWEFPLPEREEVAAEVGRILEFLQAHGAGLDGDDASIPLIRDLASLLENFREAYWITTRTAAQLDGEVVSEAAFQQRLRRYFDAAMLLGEVLKPEAATPVTFANAISRLVEVGCLERDTRAGEKGRWLRRGPAFGDLPVMAARIGGALVVPRGSRSSIDKPDALV